MIGYAPILASRRREMLMEANMTTPSTVASRALPANLDSGLSREAVLALSERKGEPDWLRESRLEGWTAFEDLPLPRWTKGIAQWWSTDVSELNLSEVKAFVAANTSADEAKKLVALADEAENAGGLLVQINSEVAYFRVPDSLKAQGVIFCSLEDAVRDHPEIVQRYLHKLVTPNRDKFAALHTAFWSGGAFVYVPEGVNVELPVHVVYRLDESGAAALAHTLVVAERGANVRYIEEFLSEGGGGDALHSGVVEVVVGEEAKVEF